MQKCGHVFLFLALCAIPSFAYPQDSSGACADKCTREFKPVCGSDGKTYGNLCTFEQEKCLKRLQIEVAKNGRCEEEEKTTEEEPNTNQEETNDDATIIAKTQDTILFPVEENDTSSNNNDSASNPGCLSKCTKIFKPVCGSDGQTHSNECIMRQQACIRRSAIEKVSDGRCESEQPPQAESKRESEDEDEATTDLAEESETGAPPTVECSSFCPLLFKPVCGSDGNTYGNECQLSAKACNEKSDLVTAHPGPCNSQERPESGSRSSDCPRLCTTQYEPVCGSDGITYSNECSLKAAGCHTKTDITLKSRGKCEAIVFSEDNTKATPNDLKCSGYCPQIFQPICASNGETFNNPCEFQLAICKGQQANLTLAFEGACPIQTTTTAESVLAIEAVVADLEEEEDCPEVCAQIYDPVCGTDGKTYGNACILRLTACKTDDSPRGLAVASKGPCKAEPIIIEAVEVEAEEECDQRCTLEINPVCGSDGQVYGNPCLFESAMCKSQGSLSKAEDESICGGG